MLTEQFARTEACFILVRLLQTFDRIENMEPPGPIKMHHTIENRSGTGVQVRLHAASAAPTSTEEGGSIDLSLGPERKQIIESWNLIP